MTKRTKIVCTLGPATDHPEVMERILLAGCDVVRVNFSHGSAEDHRRRVAMIREASLKVGKDVGILGDLQGPKIRTGRFRDGKVQLVEGAEFALDAAKGEDDGDQNSVGVTYKDLPRDVRANDILLLNDGLIVLKVRSVEGSRVNCVVETGGTLSNNKGINRLGGGLSARALTEKDEADLKTAAELGVDFLAVSFPRDGGRYGPRPQAGPRSRQQCAAGGQGGAGRGRAPHRGRCRSL